MTKKTVILLCILVLAACNGNPTPAPTSQSVEMLIQSDSLQANECLYSKLEIDNGDILFVCVTPVATAVPTNTSTPTVTVTSTRITRVTPTPTSTPKPPSTPTSIPTVTATSTMTHTDTVAYAGAPFCSDVGVQHDNRAYHALWNADEGCSWGHEHHGDPHVLDTLFGTELFNILGGEISHAWQTWAGAGANFEVPPPNAMFENDHKHEGSKWLILQGADCVFTQGSANCIINARVLAHMAFSQMDFLVRFHSVAGEFESCNTAGECGVARCGGHLDTGKLNVERGVYVALPGDPAVWASEDAERQPYRIHFPITNPPGGLDSWQSEGNQYNYLPSDPLGNLRIRCGYGVHVSDAWGGVSVDDPAITHLYCPDYQCDSNNSTASFFRAWVTLPLALDGSVFDEDGVKNGLFTFHGYTNRYGDIVSGCEVTAVDCIPTMLEHFPIARSEFRGSVEDMVEYDIPVYFPNGDRYYLIKYPN